MVISNEEEGAPEGSLDGKLRIGVAVVCCGGEVAPDGTLVGNVFGGTGGDSGRIVGLPDGGDSTG